MGDGGLGGWGLGVGGGWRGDIEKFQGPIRSVQVGLLREDPGSTKGESHC